MLAQHLAKRCVEQMGGGVIALASATAVDIGSHDIAHMEGALGDEHVVKVQSRGLLRVAHLKLRARSTRAGVAHLTTRLAVEGALVEDHDALATGFEAGHVTQAVFDRAASPTTVPEPV